MSLIESNAQAPLASEEKSLDKLEIEMEENEQMIKPDVDITTTEPIVDLSIINDDKKLEKEEDGKTNTPSSKLLNIKIPQILRKRSKDRNTEKVSHQKMNHSFLPKFFLLVQLVEHFMSKEDLLY